MDLDRWNMLLAVNQINNDKKTHNFFIAPVRLLEVSEVCEPGRYDTGLAEDNAPLEWWVEVRLGTLGQLKYHCGC